MRSGEENLQNSEPRIRFRETTTQLEKDEEGLDD